MFASKLLLVGVCAIVINFAMAKNYYIQNDAKRNWYDAFQHCAAAGRQLATVNSAAEESDLEAAIKASSIPKEYIWISATKLANLASKTYVWMSSGQTLSYNNWDVNQPDNYGGKEACAHVWSTATAGKTYAWNDLDCTDVLYYACEDKVCKDNGNSKNCCNNCCNYSNKPKNPESYNDANTYNTYNNSNADNTYNNSITYQRYNNSITYDNNNGNSTTYGHEVGANLYN